MNTPSMIKAEDAKVGLSRTLKASTFNKLRVLCGGAAPRMEDWSAVIANLIERSIRTPFS